MFHCKIRNVLEHSYCFSQPISAKGKFGCIYSETLQPIILLENILALWTITAILDWNSYTSYVSEISNNLLYETLILKQ